MPAELRSLHPHSSEFQRYMRAISANFAWENQENSESVDEAIRHSLAVLFPAAEISVNYYDHQLCHAISSRYSTNFEETLLFTIDGCGDDSFSKVYLSDKNGIRQIADSFHAYLDLSGKNVPWQEMGSPGGIYRYFTFLLGFQPDADEGKVEALAAFGKIDQTLLAELMSLFTLDREKMCLQLHKEQAEKLLNYDRMQELMSRISRENMAASVQEFLEQTVVGLVQSVVERTGVRKLSLSGGVAANVIMNLHIFEKITPHIHIIPAMADDGTAQGAAILQLLDQGYSPQDLAWLNGRYMPYFGTSYSAGEVQQRIKRFSDRIQIEELGADWPAAAARLLTEGKIGAIFHGRMEWGPRALGNRSIIADPRMPDMRERINNNIKRRPPFQPFCPSILAEEKERMFEQSYLNKHMTCAFRMKSEFAKALPGAVHVDNTARVQFVEEKDNPAYHQLLSEFKKLTGYGCIVNTSFNKHGRTIVETPENAIQDFLDTDLSFLIIEGWLVTRK